MTRSLCAVVAEQLGRLAVSSLATVSESAPKLRTVTIIHREGQFWFTTYATSEKTKELALNAHVAFLHSFSAEAGSGYVRVEGVAAPITDSDVKREVGDYAGFIGKYWTDSDDPLFALYRIRPEVVRYLAPGEMEERIVDWADQRP